MQIQFFKTVYKNEIAGTPRKKACVHVNRTGRTHREKVMLGDKENA